MGGGSSINAQIALRGLPRDFDSWSAAGAHGWDWTTVLPYFRKLEHDVDFDNAPHGQDGPVPVRRVPRPNWDRFTQAVGEVCRLSNPAVRSRSRECQLTLRVFGCLPDAGARGGTEAGVRKASREETAGGVRTGGGVRLWGFSAGV